MAATTPAASAYPSAQEVSRLSRQASAQGNQAAVNLALLEAENTQAAAATPTPPQPHPALGRLSTDAWSGWTGQLNNAQRAAGGPAWVTVPADRVVVAPGGGQGIAPVYATTQGYRARPGESVGSIPPPVAAGRR